MQSGRLWKETANTLFGTDRVGLVCNVDYRVPNKVAGALGLEVLFVVGGCNCANLVPLCSLSNQSAPPDL